MFTVVVCCLQDMALGGWQLKQVAGDQERAYKFNRNVNLKAQQSITVREVQHFAETYVILKLITIS